MDKIEPNEKDESQTGRIKEVLDKARGMAAWKDGKEETAWAQETPDKAAEKDCMEKTTMPGEEPDAGGDWKKKAEKAVELQKEIERGRDEAIQTMKRCAGCLDKKTIKEKMLWLKKFYGAGEALRMMRETVSQYVKYGTCGDCIADTDELAACIQAFHDKPDIISGMMKQCGLFFIVGDSKSGKTWFSLAMAKAIATGKSFLGYEIPEKHSVALVNLEMESLEYMQRVHDAMDDGCEIFVMDRAHSNLEMRWNAVEEACMTHDVVIVDPLYFLLEGEDSEQKEIFAALKRLVMLERKYRANLVVVHSMEKESNESICGLYIASFCDGQFSLAKMSDGALDFEYISRQFPDMDMLIRHNDDHTFTALEDAGKPIKDDGCGKEEKKKKAEGKAERLYRERLSGRRWRR